MSGSFGGKVSGSRGEADEEWLTQAGRQAGRRRKRREAEPGNPTKNSTHWTKERLDDGAARHMPPRTLPKMPVIFPLSV